MQVFDSILARVAVSLAGSRKPFSDPISDFVSHPISDPFWDPFGLIFGSFSVPVRSSLPESPHAVLSVASWGLKLAT